MRRKEGGRERRKEGRREGGKERREGRREGGREGGRESMAYSSKRYFLFFEHLLQQILNCLTLCKVTKIDKELNKELRFCTKWASVGMHTDSNT